VLFRVNLARKDKQLEPNVQVVQPEQIPMRKEGDATVRVLVGEGLSCATRDAGVHSRRRTAHRRAGHDIRAARVPGLRLHARWRGTFGANQRPAGPAQLVLLGPGEDFAVTDAAPGTRFLLMTGQPYGEVPVFNGPFVD
jgi:quercetin 2,3-dioxygenase